MPYYINQIESNFVFKNLKFKFYKADFRCDFYTNRITQHIGRDHCNLPHVFVHNLVFLRDCDFVGLWQLVPSVTVYESTELGGVEYMIVQYTIVESINVHYQLKCYKHNYIDLILRWNILATDIDVYSL